MIRAVSFDVGGTLIEPYPSVGHVYCEVAKDFGICGDAQVITRNFISAWKRREAFDYSRNAWFELVCASFPTEQVSNEMFNAIYDRFAEADVWRIYDDVMPCLESLRSRGLSLGIISNWDERLLPLLEKLGLRDRFDAIAVSCQIGVTKPDARIFKEAARRLGIEEKSILHVGDGKREDYEGALNAGFQSFLVDRSANRTLAEVTKLL